MKINSINPHYSFGIRQIRMNQKTQMLNSNIPHMVIAKKSLQEQKIDNANSDGVLLIDRTYDSFTGLRDKSFLIKALEKKMHTNQNITLAMFDMDNFKSVNELLGYETGDSFIKVISNNISDVAKENLSNAYRFGGDEFVILFNNQTDEKKHGIVSEILRRINSNEYIRGNQSKYIKNAENKLQQYSVSSAKINNLLSLMPKKELLEDLANNFTTEEAKNDAYFTQTLAKTNDNIKKSYMTLIDERIQEEDNPDIIWRLNEMRYQYDVMGGLEKEDEVALDEYLKTVYDKTAEMYQIKKWITDFNKHAGFSISGGVINLKPEDYKGKSPVEVIDMAGEVLKQNKHKR